jgi:hypothetical protein
VPLFRNSLDYIAPGQLVTFGGDGIYKVLKCEPDASRLIPGFKQWRLQLVAPTEDEVVVYEIMES